MHARNFLLGFVAVLGALGPSFGLSVYSSIQLNDEDSQLKFPYDWTQPLESQLASFLEQNGKLTPERLRSHLTLIEDFLGGTLTVNGVAGTTVPLRPLRGEGTSARATLPSRFLIAFLCVLCTSLPRYRTL